MQTVKDQYSGGAFDPRLPNGKAAGTLVLGSDRVRFETAAGARLELPLQGLKIEVGGAADRLVFFRHTIEPGCSFYTSDRSVLAHPSLAGRQALAEQVRRAHRGRRWGLTIALAALALVLAIPVALFLLRHTLVRLAAEQVPVAWEQKLGDAVFAQLSAQTRMVTDEALARDLERITTPLMAGITNRRYEFKFHISEDTAINAFALPGGNVVVNAGLLLAAKQPEEVAGVLAHEIAHVTHRHSLRQLIGSVGLVAVLQLLIGDMGGVGAVLLNHSAFLLQMKYSRDFEREADLAGWHYLLAARLNPQGMIDFFQVLKAEEERMLKALPGGEKLGDAIAIISTHPATAERLELLRAQSLRLPAKASYVKPELDFTDFQARLRQKLGLRDDHLPGSQP